MSLPESPTYYQDEAELKYKGFDLQDMLLGMGSIFITICLFFIVDTKGAGILGKFFAWLFIFSPAGCILSWIFLLRYKKPKNFDVDFVVNLIDGNGWEPNPQRVPVHPFEITEEDIVEESE
ncbi:MAG: hypothetical protein V4507_10860 [Verrucomicrobiota bacterium]